MKTMNLTHLDRDFCAEIERESGHDPQRCIQCGKCTAGCPCDFVYDFSVSQIMRLAQEGRKEELLKSKSIWLCAMCQTCSTRCPMEIDVAKVMETLRQIAWREGHVSEKAVRDFYQSFLDSVESHGRVYELGLVVDYIRKTGRFLTDVDLGPTMLTKGKLSFRPHSIKGKDKVAAIIERHKNRGAK